MVFLCCAKPVPENEDACKSGGSQKQSCKKEESQGRKHRIISVAFTPSNQLDPNGISFMHSALPSSKQVRVL